MRKALAMYVSSCLYIAVEGILESDHNITFVSKGINQKCPHVTNLVWSGFITKILKAILGAFQEDFCPQKTHKERK